MTEWMDNVEMAIAKVPATNDVDDIMITKMTMMMTKTTMMKIKRNVRCARAKFTRPPSSKERKTTFSLFARTWKGPKQKGQTMTMVIKCLLGLVPDLVLFEVND